MYTNTDLSMTETLFPIVKRHEYIPFTLFTYALHLNDSLFITFSIISTLITKICKSYKQYMYYKLSFREFNHLKEKHAHS